MARITEKVHFRFIVTECCGTTLCFVNPRLPNYCPECGRFILQDVRGWITINDVTATLQIDNGE